MSWRTVLIQNGGTLKVKDSQLLYRGEQEVTIPLEDIRCIILESLQLNLSSYLLSKCAEQNIPIVLCDYYHLPNGLLLSYHQHSRSTKVVTQQINLKQSTKDALWKYIIQAKIRHQAKMLEHFNIEGFEGLFNLVKKVKSGDKDNIEAYAASRYFNYWQGSKFNRRNDDEVNALLNYGYSIVRSSIARQIVAHGLIPEIGIHHHSELNSFNLVDDLIEPFRPYVDYQVEVILQAGHQSLNTTTKSLLCQTHNMMCKINHVEYEMWDALNLFIISILDVIKGNSKPSDILKVEPLFGRSKDYE